MIHVLASIQVKEGQMSKFLEIFKANIPNVLLEKGCLEYVPTQDFPTGLAAQSQDSNIVTIIEKWESLEDLRTHLAAPHMLAYKENVADLVTSVTLKVLAAA